MNGELRMEDGELGLFTQLSILNSPFSILHSQFSILFVFLLPLFIRFSLRFLQRPVKDPFNLSVHTTELISCPFLERLVDTGINTNYKIFLFTHRMDFDFLLIKRSGIQDRLCASFAA